MEIMNHFLLISSLAELSSETPRGFGLNTNFLEANVINIVILLSGVIYLGRGFLTSSLEVRQQKVAEAIQEAKERLVLANTRLIESEKQLTKAQSVIEGIKQEAAKTARTVKEGKLDIQRLTNNGKANIEKAELQIKKQIQQHVTDLAIEKVTVQLKEYMTPNLQSKVIDSNIANLRGQL
jgi:F-type H+-transporting ATPase subunit b